MRYPHDVPTLTDGTVTLRAHHEDDVAGVLEQSTDPLSRAWTTVPVPYTRDHAKRFVHEVMPGGWVTDQEWGFAVEYDGRYAATVTLRNEGERRAEIAYAAHPRFRGTGGMERALRLLLDWGFADRDLQTVVWWANRGNWSSRKLAWRLGFAIDASLRAWLPGRGELLDAWGGTLLAQDQRRPRHAWLDAPRVESDRLPLRLRRAGPDDVDRIVEACNDEETTRWLGEIPRPYVREHATSYLLSCTEQMAAGRGMIVAVADHADDRLLAMTGLSDLHATLRTAELGYWCHPAERGRGVATEAARLMLRHALLAEDDGGLGLVRVSARAATGNAASIAVLKRVGMRQVGTVRSGSLTSAGVVDAVLHEMVERSMV